MSAKNEFNVENIFDRIIEVTEKNISTQAEFLHSIYGLKGRFDISDRDHQDFKEKLKDILENGYELVSLMRKTSNDDVILIIKELKESISHIDIKDLADDVKEIKDSYKILKWFAAIIAGLMLFGQIIFQSMQSYRNTEIKEELSNEIKILLKK